MPRARTEIERQRVQDALLESGRDLFVRMGLAKVTIEELAKGAGIGKGTFYQFFDSKEALFMAVLEVEERGFKEVLRRELDRAEGPAEAVRTLLVAAATRLDEHPFLRLLVDPVTVTTLMVRLDPAVVMANQNADRDFFESLAVEWRGRGWLRSDLSPRRVYDLVAAMFALSLQRELVGVDVVQGAVEEIADALSRTWTQEA